MSGEIIDVHTHVWPDAIAAKALAPAVPEIPRRGDGRVSSLLAAMEDAGVGRSVCLGVADGAGRVAAANRYAGALVADRLIGFGSIHVDWRPEDLVADLRKNHLRGVKLHPLYQHFDLDDPRINEILDALQGEFVVLSHVGGGGDSETDALGDPTKIRRLVREFPRLDLIAAHFGGYRMLDLAEEAVIGLPVYVDTAWPPSLAALDPSRVRAIIERHGPDRVIFGSDWPMASPADEIAAIERLGLSAEATEAILGGNLRRLLGEGG